MNRDLPMAADADLQARIDNAGQRSLAWLDSLQLPGLPRGVSRISSAHDPVRWPGVLLPGTYNAVMARELLDGLSTFTAHEREAAAGWIVSHRRADGIFRMPGMQDGEVYKKPDREETWRYIDFHVSNYSLGAIDALTPDARPLLEFARPYLQIPLLKAWLADRDLRDPWQEGNNIVNLGSFLQLMDRQAALEGDSLTQQQVARTFEVLFDWHDRLQEPATGFWGVGQLSDPLRALHAMAGSMHNFHLFHLRGRPLPYQDRAVDWALTQPADVVSACIDVDLVDLLVHAQRLIDHRRRDIEAWLRLLLPRLLDAQLPDGGFADVAEGLRRQDGWVDGYAEPQGISNTFATWFRWIALAMIDDALWPGRRPWRFRRMAGIGYRWQHALRRHVDGSAAP